MNYDLAWMPTLLKVAKDAGDIIMQYRADGFESMRKGDNSPVTEADKAADALICDVLHTLTPDIPVISEEGSHDEAAARDGYFWCVDPLDGTKGFIRGEDEFTVNIGLIHDYAPVLGVIYVPAQEQLYYGSKGEGAYRAIGNAPAQSIQTRPSPEGGLTAVVSKHHGTSKENEMGAAYGITDFIAAASSLKFCRIAEGAADIYPRFGPTMEWDTAAGHAILVSAGGNMVEMGSSKVFRYAKDGFLNGMFVASGGGGSISNMPV